MAMPIEITAAWLEQQPMCRPEDVAVFRAEWGESAIVTREGLIRAAEMGLSIEWLHKNSTYADLITELLPESRVFGRTVSLDALMVRNCPAGSIKVFRETFGDRVELSRAVLIDLAERGFDCHWVRRNLNPSLPGPTLDHLREAYRVVKASPGRAARMEAQKAAGAELQEAIRQPLAEHHARMAAAGSDEERDASLAIFMAATKHHYDACREAQNASLREDHRVAERDIPEAFALAESMGLP